ncbi:HSP20-like chaperones superfamily protein [Perilla frutescens var. frutescens]|nr:HSP20-like chaperones superfamily protein [Perilla frutescens var. frutescens]
MISKKNEKSLKNWKPPPISNSDVGISFIGRAPLTTVKKKIPLPEGYATFPLLSDNLTRTLRKQFGYLKIAAIQVALKPTKLGSNASAVISLRDKRSKKFNDSVFAMVESSLCDGPIHFSYNPTRIVPLSDLDASSSFAIDIKTSMMRGGENVILMHKFYYRVRKKMHGCMSIGNSSDGRGKTTLFLTNIAESNLVVSKTISWDEVAVPERWRDEENLLSSTGQTGAAVANARAGWKETADAHVFEVDVPGLKGEEVKVEVEAGRMLQISGERSNVEGEKNEKWHCEERSSGKFLRRFRLPENAQMEQVTAKMENGVLTVTVPKEGVNEKREVKVKVSGG